MKRLLLLIALVSTAMATEEAFPPSPIGAAELKTLPSGVLLKAAATGNYFAQANRLFGPLFSYISSHDIAMTTPVEARIEGAAMFFWVAKSQQSKVAGSTGAVEVVEIPERWVASLGARGSYSAENFAKTRDQLLAWLGQRKDVEAAGSPYAVFWNGPFMPGFLKRYEVHVPVRAVGPVQAR
jgi:hypothetical protein